MDILKIKRYNMFTGRAGTGIYLILRQNCYVKRVLIPANICYAAIFPIIYSGAKPVFCDIELSTGNINLETVAGHLNDFDAVIVPHMYGNPVSDIEDITEICKKNGKLLIEDCASAMGASVNGTLCGSFGDYSIFSTGYSKTVDLGGGGIVISDNSLDDMKTEYELLPEFNDKIELSDTFFSKLYRLIRNNPNQFISEYVWEGLRPNLQCLYLYKDHRFDERMKKLDEVLPDTIDKRKENYELYHKLIKCKNLIFELSEGSVPWRFSLIVCGDKRRKMIDFLLSQNIPVSDWYPTVTPIFGIDEKKYPNATLMGEQIVNFPLLLDKNEIIRICDCFNDYIET